MRVVAVAVTGALMAGVCGANLLSNADFALDGTTAQLGTANIVGWSSWGTDGYYTDEVGSDLAVKMWWDTCGLYQDWAATPGQQYDLSAQGYQRSTEPLNDWQAYLKVEFYDSGNNQLLATELDYLTESDPQDTWVGLSGSATAPANTSYGRVIMGLTGWTAEASGSAYFDDASVLEAIPEPSTLAFGLLGCGALLFRFRSKR